MKAIALAKFEYSENWTIYVNRVNVGHLHFYYKILVHRIDVERSLI